MFRSWLELRRESLAIKTIFVYFRQKALEKSGAFCYINPMKSCSICGITKHRDAFYPRPSRPCGMSPQCKECERNRKAKYAREWRAKNQELNRMRDREWRAKNPDRVRSMNFKKAYGIDNARYEEMLDAQDYSCAICSVKHSDKSRETRLNIDHCHTTGRIRGLLCAPCNKGLGHFRDTIDLLKAAIKYLA